MNIVNGAYYWLMFNNNNANQMIGVTWGVGASKQKTQPYGAWPSPFGTGGDTWDGRASIMATDSGAGGGNNPPTVATAAAASPSPAIGDTTHLSVLGADDGGEANLTYIWATTGTLPAAVSFSVNSTNAAKNTRATFTKAGAYSFRVIITDAGALACTSTVAVTVNQTLTSIIVTPASGSVYTDSCLQFSAAAKDQFGDNKSPQPVFTWSVSNGGTISSNGRFTAGNIPGGPFTVTASSEGKTGTAMVTVLRLLPRYVLTVTNDGHGTTTPSGNVSVDSGALTTISATPSFGYAFSQWSVSAGAATFTNQNSASTTVKLTAGNATIKANFTSTQGNGLHATYYDGLLPSADTVWRVDTTINFTWNGAAPASGISGETFLALWTGQVKPAHSETYTFYTTTDDGCRLWVNGQLIIDNWVDPLTTERNGTIALTAGIKYDICMAYFQNGEDAKAKLKWSSASTSKQIIPKTCLFSTGFSGTKPIDFEIAATLSRSAIRPVYRDVLTLDYQVLTPAGVKMRIEQDDDLILEIGDINQTSYPGTQYRLTWNGSKNNTLDESLVAPGEYLVKIYGKRSGESPRLIKSADVTVLGAE